MFKKILAGLAVIIVPVAVALLYYLIFSRLDEHTLLQVMSVGFFFTVPLGIGALTVSLAPLEKIRSRTYSFFMPWVSVLCFAVVTLFFALEGWACWLMALPIFLGMSSIGGLITRNFRLIRHNRLNLSLIMLLPFFISPVEHFIGSIPKCYKADTHVDIHAPADKIWENVTRVRAIDAKQDKGWLTKLLHFPRPVKAELDFDGVGGSREAIFTDGLVFHEKVLEYEDRKKMVFTIKAHPYEIPSTTMDEHVVIGGDYFDVLTGTYELEQLGRDYYRVHLYSYFEMNTTFNFYASLWAEWIMKDIQNNILQVLESRCENGLRQ